MNNSYQLQEAMTNIYGQGDQLLEKWGKYIDTIRQVGIDDDRPVSDMTLVSTAIMLENLSNHHQRLDETTLAVSVGSFIHHGYDLIAAVMPSLIANEILSVQPQTRKIGEIFYMEFLYGTNKGVISEGDTMFGWQTAGNSEFNYTSDLVDQEAIGALGSANYTGNLSMVPALAGEVTLTDGNLVVTDDGAGNLVGDVNGGGTNTIDYTNGAYNVTFSANTTGAVVTSYRTDFEANPGNIPEVNLHIQSIPVIARPRKLRARYSLDASFDINAAFGRSVGAELDVALASEVRQEIDGELLNQLLLQAGAGTFTWDRTPPAGISFAEHKWTFIDELIKSSNGIFTATRRAVGNFIVAGTGMCNVIESLAPRFKPSGRIQPGPHYLGMLDNYKVYKDPFYPADEAVVGYKGDQWMESGLVYAPYMPLFTTKPIMLDDFVTRKGLATSYAKKMVNPLFYAKMNVTTT